MTSTSTETTKFRKASYSARQSGTSVRIGVVFSSSSIIPLFRGSLVSGTRGSGHDANGFESRNNGGIFFAVFNRLIRQSLGKVAGIVDKAHVRIKFAQLARVFDVQPA